MRQDIARFRRARWVDSGISLFDVPNNSLFIDYKRSAVTKTLLFVEDPIVLNDRAFEIA